MQKPPTSPPLATCLMYSPLPKNFRAIIRTGKLRSVLKYEGVIMINKVLHGIIVKAGLSPSKKYCVICFIDSPLKMMKNAF